MRKAFALAIAVVSRCGIAAPDPALLVCTSVQSSDVDSTGQLKSRGSVLKFSLNTKTGEMSTDEDVTFARPPVVTMPFGQTQWPMQVIRQFNLRPFPSASYLLVHTRTAGGTYPFIYVGVERYVETGTCKDPLQ